MTQEAILSLLTSGLSGKKIMSISGPAGTGKTTLALFLIGNSLSFKAPYDESCIWIQASEAFPKKRFNVMFNTSPNKLTYLNENVFIIPNKKPCDSYPELLSTIKKIISDEFITPPDLKFIVIDNISHHLRYKISLVDDIAARVTLLNDFFNSYLLPLIFLCNRENITLILIHEASFDINQGRNRPFFYKLYDRIDALKINLIKEFTKTSIEIIIDNKSQVFKYRLVDSGIILMK